MSEWKETEIGNIPSNWDYSCLLDIASKEKKAIISGPFGSNISRKYFVDEGVPVIRGNNLSLNIGQRFIDNNFVYVTEDKAEDLNTWATVDDLVFTAAGTIGQVGIIAHGQNYRAYIISNKQLRVTVDSSKMLPIFAYYWFASNFMHDWIASCDTGSTIPLINLSVLKSLPVPVPPLPEQRAIASVLSSLDDKIDLLHCQNKTLEAVAETLFRQWFVEGADEGWEVVKLGKYVKCTTGYSYKSADLNPSINALVTLKNFARDGSFRMDGFKEYTGKYKDTQIVKQGDLVVSHTDITQEADIIGNPALVIDTGQFETLIITMDLMKVESNVAWLGKEFLYYLFKSPDFKFYCLGCSNGTTVLHMSRNAIPGYEFKIPNKNMVKIFTATVVPILEKTFKNTFQIRTLEKLRDTLLPKLMSGEVRMKLEQQEAGT